MRLTPLILTLTALTALTACKREDSSSPADASTTTSDADASSTETPTSDAEPSAEPNADSLEACKHMGAMMHAELGELVETSEEELAANALECAKGIDSKRATMSVEAWETWHSCAMVAQTVEAAAACG